MLRWIFLFSGWLIGFTCKYKFEFAKFAAVHGGDKITTFRFLIQKVSLIWGFLALWVTRLIYIYIFWSFKFPQYLSFYTLSVCLYMGYYCRTDRYLSKRFFVVRCIFRSSWKFCILWLMGTFYWSVKSDRLTTPIPSHVFLFTYMPWCWELMVCVIICNLMRRIQR